MGSRGQQYEVHLPPVAQPSALHFSDHAFTTLQIHWIDTPGTDTIVIAPTSAVFVRPCRELPGQFELVVRVDYVRPSDTTDVLLAVCAVVGAPDGPGEPYHFGTGEAHVLYGGLANFAQHREQPNDPYFAFAPFRYNNRVYIGLFAYRDLTRGLRVMIDYGRCYVWPAPPLILPWY